jgi:F-type H+-transporting ATPase subunit b
MDQTLKQLGELLLGSIPTMIFLAERHSLTDGAIERARADIAAAEVKTAEYEHRFREATLAVFKAQEEHRQTIVRAREAAVAAARAQAQQQINAAKATVEQDKAAAQSQLQGEGERLAADVIRRVLQPMSFGPSASAGGGR